MDNCKPTRCIDPIIKFCQECQYGWVHFPDWVETKEDLSKGNGYYLQSDNVAEARLQSLSILVNNWNDRRKKNNTSIKGEI